jgi:GxxExxY protein
MLLKTDPFEKLTETVIGCGIRVHEYFGPGLFESVYRGSMQIELQDAGLDIDTSRRIPLVYKGIDLGCVFEADLIVNGVLVVELKAIETLAPVHQTQLMTYLKLTGCPVGLLLNFNVPYLKQGIKRVVRPDLYMKTEKEK